MFLHPEVGLFVQYCHWPSCADRLHGKEKAKNLRDELEKKSHGSGSDSSQEPSGH